MLTGHAKLLFIGDSITDCGRRGDQAPLGNGYVRVINDMLLARNPQSGLTMINQGVGGHTIRDLKDRWDSDVIAQAPDILSVSIGVNDVWRQVAGRHAEAVLIDEFEETYDALLRSVVAHHPRTKLVLMEPSVIEENPLALGNQLLKPYCQVVSKLAQKYGAVLIPIHQVFLKAIEQRGDLPLTTDGVHPLPKGHILMAVTWLDTVGW